MNALARTPVGWRRISSDTDIAPARWANGAGTTTELISRIRSAEITGTVAPAWRLSVARLEAACAFSELPGVQRSFMPVGGSVRLDIAGKVVDVDHLQTVRFDGGDPVRLLELSGPCHAINLMVDHSRTAPGVTLVGPGPLRSDAAVAIPQPDAVDGAFEAWQPTNHRVRGTGARLVAQVVTTAGSEHTIVLGYN